MQTTNETTNTTSTNSPISNNQLFLLGTLVLSGPLELPNNLKSCEITSRFPVDFVKHLPASTSHVCLVDSLNPEIIAALPSSVHHVQIKGYVTPEVLSELKKKDNVNIISLYTPLAASVIAVLSSKVKIIIFGGSESPETISLLPKTVCKVGVLPPYTQQFIDSFPPHITVVDVDAYKLLRPAQADISSTTTADITESSMKTTSDTPKITEEVANDEKSKGNKRKPISDNISHTIYGPKCKKPKREIEPDERELLEAVNILSSMR